MTSSNVTHVVVGLILNGHGQILVSQRRPGTHKSGLWEFPGGKKEPTESIQTALKRELLEELGIRVVKFHPFTKVLYHYPEKTVLLDVWMISKFDGSAEGREGQVIEWRSLKSLKPNEFPEANKVIITRVQLPAELAITPNLDTVDDVASLFFKYAERGICLVQFRQTQLDKAEYIRWLKSATVIAQEFQIQLLASQLIGALSMDSYLGFHANSETIMSIKKRPVSKEQLFSASCHNLRELLKAEKVDADFVTLSPVCYTSKYEIGAELGWDRFADLANQVSLPVYALGGIGRSNLEQAMKMGAHGVAGIKAYL